MLTQMVEVLGDVGELPTILSALIGNFMGDLERIGADISAKDFWNHLIDGIKGFWHDLRASFEKFLLVWGMAPGEDPDEFLARGMHI